MAQVDGDLRTESMPFQGVRPELRSAADVLTPTTLGRNAPSSTRFADWSPWTSTTSRNSVAGSAAVATSSGTSGSARSTGANLSEAWGTLTARNRDDGRRRALEIPVPQASSCEW